MGAHAAGGFLRAKSQPLAQLERQRAANGHTFAMQQPVGIPRSRFQRMAEGMAQVQKRPLALFGFIARNDSGLHRHRNPHRMLAQPGVARHHAGGIDLQPVEETGVAQQPVFHHLAIARQKIAARQRGQRVDIGQHQAGLVKRAHQVLALGGVDAGLAADGTVHLGQKRCRHLHEAHPAPQNRRRKPHQIANHAATQRHHHIAPLDLLVQQPFRAAGQLPPALCAFPGRQGQGGMGNARRRQPFGQVRQMQPCHRFICHHRHTRAAQQGRNLRPRPVDKPRPDAHLIGPRAQRDWNRIDRHPTSFPERLAVPARP